MKINRSIDATPSRRPLPRTSSAESLPSNLQALFGDDRIEPQPRSAPPPRRTPEAPPVAPRLRKPSSWLQARGWPEPVAKAAVGLVAGTAAAITYSALALSLGASVPVATCLAAVAGWFALVSAKDALLGLRSDGTLVKNATVMRRFMPYVITTRESARIDYQRRLRLDGARAFVEQWNSRHGADLQITTFHVILAAIQRANLLHPGLNRFVIGKRLFERNNFSIAFAVKSAKKAYGALRTVKLEAIAGEDFAGYVRRINKSIHAERAMRKSNATESEMKLVERLPRPLLSLALWGRDLLDSEGLWPKSWIDPDPLYASVFVANLGSLDKDEMPNVKHHLYECGTVSLFGTLCSIDESGPYPTMLVNWTYDERVNDGHNCLAPLKAMRQAVEQPHLLLEQLDAERVAAGRAEDRAAGDDALARENAMEASFNAPGSCK